jgi:hypothetical protein
MDTIINLLKDKNYHLDKFYQLNESELLNFAEGNFDNLEVFYQSRETILDLIRCIDRLIEAASNSQGDAPAISNEHKKEMIKAMNYKNDVAQRILSQDLQILSAIEQAKSNIIRELRTVQAGKKAIGGYKSMDERNKLDEEA